jgi:hypothetical protein
MLSSPGVALGANGSHGTKVPGTSAAFPLTRSTQGRFYPGSYPRWQRDEVRRALEFVRAIYEPCLTIRANRPTSRQACAFRRGTGSGKRPTSPRQPPPKFVMAGIGAGGRVPCGPPWGWLYTGQNGGRHAQEALGHR